jgi:hypothetical protein
MGEPPGQGSGTLHSSYTNPTAPAVSGIQLDGYFPDSCNAYVSEPALTAKNGSPFIPGCTPPTTPGALCVSGCHHDGEFVIRIPDEWNGHLLPIKTDSDIYAQMVQLAGRAGRYRYYTVAGGNHVDPQFDDHYGIDSYGTNVLRPILPCARAAIDALAAWVEQDTPPPPSHTIARPDPDTASDLANHCSLS